MKKPLHCIGLLLFMVGSSNLTGQDYFAEIQTGYNHGTPKGRFSSSNYKRGNGMYLRVMSTPHSKWGPLKFRIGADWQNLCSGSRTFSLKTDDSYDGNIDIKYRNRSNGFYLVERVSTKINRVEIFGDVILGYRKFKSEEYLYDGSRQGPKTLVLDEIMQGGIAGGFACQLGKTGISLECRMAYIKGNGIRSFDLDNITATDNSISVVSANGSGSSNASLAEDVVNIKYDNSLSSDQLFVSVGVNFKLVWVKSKPINQSAVGKGGTPQSSQKNNVPADSTRVKEKKKMDVDVITIDLRKRNKKKKRDSIPRPSKVVLKPKTSTQNR